MHRKGRKAIFAVLLISCLALDIRSQVRRGRTHSPEPCPDEKVYTGKYRNRYYGFSITIPPGLKGYWNSARCVPADEGCICFTDHGRVIPLSDSAQIDAFTGYETLDWSASDYEKSYLDDLKKREGVERVRPLSSRRVLLGNLKARRSVIQFTEKKKELITDRVIVVHKGVEYDLILSTSENRYRTDRRTFEKVIASWKLIPRMR